MPRNELVRTIFLLNLSQDFQPRNKNILLFRSQIGGQTTRDLHRGKVGRSRRRRR